MPSSRRYCAPMAGQILSVGFWYGPNNSTRAAVAHPVAYAFVMATAAAGLGAAGGMSSGPLSAVIGAVGAFLIVLMVTLFLWRSGGPGRRWAAKHGMSEKGVDSRP